MTRKPIVFVSCGQVTAGEQRLGRDVCELVRELTDYEPYFAETVTSLGGLTQNIFKRLHEAAAYVFILHARGQVSFGNGESTRASVWVEQEVAITAFLTQILSKQCHVAAYAKQGVALEGERG